MGAMKDTLTPDEIAAIDLGITLPDYEAYKADMKREDDLFTTFTKITREHFEHLQQITKEGK